MRKTIGRLVVVSAIIVGLAALIADLIPRSSEQSSSLPKTVIILLEDIDGGVGEVEVTTQGGSQVLTEPNQATGVNSATDAPSAPFTVTDEEIAEVFGAVTAARPALPTKVTLIFVPGSSILDTAGEQIEQIVAEVGQRQAARVSIYAYASSAGNVDLNRAAGLLRARAVSSALASRGLDNSQFILRTIIDPGADVVQLPDGRAVPNNRRIEVVIR